MPTYRLGEQKFNRKNFYLPCIINAHLDDMTDEEYVAVMKATYWADNITNSEWPVVLGEEGASKTAKSKLKKKGVGWMMALSRIAYLNPELYSAIWNDAKKLYEEQIKEPNPILVSKGEQPRDA